jgi:hypothetical protein
MKTPLEELEFMIEAYIEIEAQNRSNDYLLELQEKKLKRIPIEYQVKFLKEERDKYVFDSIWEKYDGQSQYYNAISSPEVLQKYKKDEFYLNHLIKKEPLHTIVLGKDYTARIEVLNQLIQSHELKPIEPDINTPITKKETPSRSITESPRTKTARNLLDFLSTPHPIEGQLFQENEFERLMEYIEYMLDNSKIPENIEPITPANPPAKVIQYVFYSMHIEFTGKGRKHEYPYAEFLMQVFPKHFRWKIKNLKKKLSEKPDSWAYWTSKDR